MPGVVCPHYVHVATSKLCGIVIRETPPEMGAFLRILAAMNEFGISTVACGRPHYGLYAGALAVTLRAAGYQGNLCLIWTEQSRDALPPEVLALFTDFLEAPEHTYMHKGKRAYHNVKIWLDQISPYQTALNLDADVVAGPQAAAHIAALQDSEHGFLMWVPAYGRRIHGTLSQAQSPQNYTWWYKALGLAYGALTKCATVPPVSYMPQTQSTYIFYDRDAAAELFAMCRRLADCLQGVTDWRGMVPDEAYFNGAWAALGWPEPRIYTPVLGPCTGLPHAWGLCKGVRQWDAAIMAQGMQHYPFFTPVPDTTKGAVETWNSLVTDACAKLGINPVPLQYRKK